MKPTDRQTERVRAVQWHEEDGSECITLLHTERGHSVHKGRHDDGLILRADRQVLEGKQTGTNITVSQLPKGLIAYQTNSLTSLSVRMDL